MKIQSFRLAFNLETLKPVLIAGGEFSPEMEEFIRYAVKEVHEKREAEKKYKKEVDK